jgi:Xaa-Pro aminopeptidase
MGVEAHEMRITTLKKSLEEHRLDAYLVTNLKNIYYFTGFLDIAGATLSLLVPLDGAATLFAPPLSYEAAREKARNCIVEEVSKGVRPFNRICKELTDRQIDVVGFDDLPISRYLQLTKDVASTSFSHIPSLVGNLRRVKDEQEINLMKKAAELTDVGALAGMEYVQAGVREYEVAAEIEYAMRRHGSEGAAFETVVASGPRSSHPHGVSTDRTITWGDAVVLDLGAVYRGYRSDITRTVIVGKPSSKQADVLNLLMKAKEAAFHAIREGVKAKTVDKRARTIIAEKGFDRYFIHGLGHGVGLDIHESPTLSPESEDILVAGNVVTDEPGIYLPGFGARIEDTVLVHKKGGEKMTKTRYFEW